MSAATWHVRSYPDDQILHTADSYEAADEWRSANNLRSYICPSWPWERMREILTAHDEQYLGMRPGPGVSIRCEMLCMDTIEAIRAVVEDEVR